MKLSIITVTYNSANFLADCLTSVADQSYENVEHLVIDGASTDETLDILTAHRDRLAVLISEPDGGIYHAMNKGLGCAQGEVVGFLNSDDFYENSVVLERVAQLFKDNPSLDACYADLAYVDRVNLHRTVRYWKSCAFKYGAFAKGWCPPHPTFFVRKSIFDRYGKFDLAFRIAADVELMMRFLEVNKIRSIYIPELWVRMRVGGTTNKSLKNIWIQNNEVLAALRRHDLPFSFMAFFGHKVVSRSRQFFEKPSS